MQAGELAILERLLGGPIQSAEHAPWGFTNRTDILTLPGGERVVMQRYMDRIAAQSRIRLTSDLRDELEASGIVTPRLIRGELRGDPPYAIFEALPGLPGPAVLGREVPDHALRTIATSMGQMLRLISAVPVDQIPLPSLWADPDLLASRATAWLDARHPDLAERTIDNVRSLIAGVPELFRGRVSVLAHGDFGPANVLVVGDRITGLLDWESARRADPLFDAAWWGWLVRYHHPRDYAIAWPALLEAAGFETQDERFGSRVLTLQVVRLLELSATSGESSAKRMWTQRLSETARGGAGGVGLTPGAAAQ